MLFRAASNPSGCLSILVLTLLCGCAEPNPLNRQEVIGEVLLVGKPVAFGSIEFVSPEFMSGAPIKDGKFRIRQELGIPPGEYQIRIFAPDLSAPKVADTSGPGEIRVAREQIPDEYNMKTQEKRTIEEGKVNRFMFDIPTLRK